MTTDATGGRSLLLVHGRDFKPAADVYLNLSVAAMRAGVERDYPDQLEAFDAVSKDLAWYGDLNAALLRAAGKRYDESLDVGDRQNVLNTLRHISARKNFGIRQYDHLPGKSALPEAMAGLVSPVLGAVGLSGALIRLASKDFAHYFDATSDYASVVRGRLRDKLCSLLARGGEIALVSHGTGSVVAYDVLWQLSHDPEYKQQFGGCKVSLWLTLGSPLGDAAIRKRLLGSCESAAARFPDNVISWHNVSAEDDYTCHDNTLADDFRNMMRQRQVSSVQDYKVFNLAVRYGKSNPHSSMGYYIHPRVSKILVDWLCSGDALQGPTRNP